MSCPRNGACALMADGRMCKGCVDKYLARQQNRIAELEAKLAEATETLKDESGAQRAAWAAAEHFKQERDAALADLARIKAALEPTAENVDGLAVDVGLLAMSEGRNGGMAMVLAAIRRRAGMEEG